MPGSVSWPVGHRQRVAGERLGQLGDHADVAGGDRVDRLAAPCRAALELADALVLAAAWRSARGELEASVPEKTRT